MSLPHFLLISNQDSFTRSLVPQALPPGDLLSVTANVFDAFVILRESKPAAVLIDLGETDEDAAVLCRMVRRHSDVLIVMLATPTTRDQITRGYNLGADAHIEIPCDPRVFRARLGALLRRAPAQTQAVTA